MSSKHPISRRNRYHSNGNLWGSRLLILFFILITLYPIAFVLLTSVKSTKEFYTNPFGLPKVWEFANYANAWSQAHMGEYFKTTLIITLITTAAVLLLASLAGYALARLQVPFADLIVLAMMGLTVLPSESVIMPMYLTISKLGLIGTTSSLILPYIGWWLPTNIFILKNFFETLPSELIESARVDGCTDLKIFGKIIIPLMMPAIGTCTIMCFSGIWGEMLWASIALSSSPLRTLSLGVLAFQGQFSTNWGLMSAAIIVILVPIIIVFIAFQKYFVQGLTSGSVKG